jgi:hypothetical protein
VSCRYTSSGNTYEPNRQAQKDRQKAEYDYQVNRKAEREIEEVLKKLDRIEKKLGKSDIYLKNLFFISNSIMNFYEKGYKHKTGVFGTDAEKYFSRLFMMLQNPNGSRRPDFITLDGQYNPRISMELKSGRGHKGVLVDYQLHYAVTCEKDYIEILGEEPKPRDDVLPGVGLNGLDRKPVRYYYDLLNRTDEVSAEELDRPFSNIN